MIRVIMAFSMLLITFQTIACEKNIEPATDCWNPPTKHVNAELQRFYNISEEINQAVFINDLERIETLAIEYLQLSQKFHKNWNYGNAIHDANIALGIAELRKGNIKKSAKYLIAAGKSPGSPQLDSFGPELKLANVLLQNEQREAVKKYLSEVRKFWKMDKGLIEKWLISIESGKTPKLSRFQR